MLDGGHVSLLRAGLREPPILYEHRGCGGSVHAHAACDVHGKLAPADVAVVIGPGMPAEYLARRRPQRTR